MKGASDYRCYFITPSLTGHLVARPLPLVLNRLAPARGVHCSRKWMILACLFGRFQKIGSLLRGHNLAGIYEPMGTVHNTIPKSFALGVQSVQLLCYAPESY